jgi:hypothetical protein
MNKSQTWKEQIGPNIKIVADEVDVSVSLLYKMIDGSHQGDWLSKIEQVIEATDSHAIAKYVAVKSGGRFVPPFDPKDAAVYAIIPKLCTGFAEFMQTMCQAFEDDKITLDEAHEIRTVFNDLGGVIEGFLQHVEGEESVN